MSPFPVAVRAAWPTRRQGASGTYPLPAACDRSRQLWLIRLRWIAVVGVVIVSGVAAWAGWIQTFLPILVITAGVAAYNHMFTWWARSPAAEREGEGVIAIQLLCDLAAQSVLLHLGGGIENPFLYFFLLQMALAGMLLERRRAYLMGVAAIVLVGGTFWAEQRGWLPHHPLLVGNSWAGMLRSVHEHGDHIMLAGVMTSFALTCFGVIYFVQDVEGRRLEAERRIREREKVAAARERMARIGAVSAGVAHTVRNPLHGVLNCLDYLESSVADPDETEDLTETFGLVREGLERIEFVTRRLLSLSEGEELSPEPTDLGRMIHDVARAFDPSPVHLELSDGLASLPAVEVDPGRMAEVLHHLLENAVQACAEGGSVDVSGQSDGETVRLEITDDGGGISPKVLDRVFDPFFTTKEGGSGLGLTLVRRTIEEHGGVVSVSSRPGEGTCFSLELPIHSSLLDIA